MPGILEEEKEIQQLGRNKIMKEDALEVGFLEGKPRVKISGRLAREFRTKYKQFVNLVALAAARKKGEGWINKRDLDLGESDQALSDIRQWILAIFYTMWNQKK